jgi:hypothetical protein
MAERQRQAGDDPWSRPQGARSMTLPWTVLLLASGLGLAAFCLWHQRRPRELGDVPWFPSTLLLGLGLVLAIVALAHLVTLLTGIELRGRRGF